MWGGSFPRPPPPAAVALEDVRDVTAADAGAAEVDPRPAVAALNHRAARERLPAETRDQIPRVVTWGGVNGVN